MKRLSQYNNAIACCMLEFIKPCLGCRCGLGRHLYCIEGVYAPDGVTEKWKKRYIGTMVCSLCTFDAQQTAALPGETQAHGAPHEWAAWPAIPSSHRAMLPVQNLPHTFSIMAIIVLIAVAETAPLTSCNVGMTSLALCTLTVPSQRPTPHTHRCAASRCEAAAAAAAAKGAASCAA